MKNIHTKLFELKKVLGVVVKGAQNDFLKTRYATLNDVIDATEEELTDADLMWVDIVEDMYLKSYLIDMDTEEQIEVTTPLILQKNDMQSLGSAITYARRYARLTTLGLKVVDDDGNEASGKVFVKPVQIKQINELILQTKTNTKDFLKYFHVPSVKDLTDVAAKQAIKTLTLKKEKGAKNGTNESN